MTSLPERAARNLRLLSLFSLLALFALASCGPGSGGTGTGPLMALSFSSPGPGSPAGGNGGAAREAHLQVEDGTLRIDIDCGTSSFIGLWPAPVGGNVVVSPGHFTAGGESQPAVARLSFDAAPPESVLVNVHVEALADGSLLQEASLARDLTGAPPAACP